MREYNYNICIENTTDKFRSITSILQTDQLLFKTCWDQNGVFEKNGIKIYSLDDNITYQQILASRMVGIPLIITEMEFVSLSDSISSITSAVHVVQDSQKENIIYTFIPEVMPNSIKRRTTYIHKMNKIKLTNDMWLRITSLMPFDQLVIKIK